MPQSPFAQFHGVVRGRCYAGGTGIAEPILLTGGDMIVFPQGASHWLAESASAPRVSGLNVLAAHQNQEPVFCEGEIGATLLCGHFELDRAIEHPLLESLPGMLLVRSTEQHAAGWLESVARLIQNETAAELPGAAFCVDQLANVLFIQLLRIYMAGLDGPRGFVAAIRDARISGALELMHNRLATEWTVDRLARASGISRTGFAVRFKNLVGMTPMQYLTYWRLQKANQAIRETRRTIGEIAESVGYQSEAAFHRAFKRHFQVGPGAVRRAGAS